MIRSTELLSELKDVSTTIKNMKAEIQPSLDMFDEKKREKTQLTDRLRSVVLQETDGQPTKEYFDGLVSTYFDREFVILDNTTAVRQIIEFANKYREETGVDIIGSLLSVVKSRVEPRIQTLPELFGLQPLITDGGVEHHSKGMSIVIRKKVRIAANVE